MDNQGGLANRQGRTLEQLVIATLQPKGFKVVPYPQYHGTLLETWEDDVLLTNVPFENIYGQQSKTEFKIVSKRYGEYRIECKWQQSSGSVDEKFPYLYLNCVERMPERRIILIVDGRGARPGAVEWLRRAAREKLYLGPGQLDKEIQVFSMTEFVIWANKTFRG